MSEQEVSQALKEVDLNTTETSSEVKVKIDQTACAYCSKTGAKKRCAKRHPKCLKKIFCDEVCEKAGHQKAKVEGGTENEDKEAKVKAAAAAKKKAKKAKKAGKADKADQGQFWWNNSVYASW